MSARVASALLDPQNPFSVLNYDRGVPLWVGCGRSLRLVPDSSVLPGALASARLARSTLVSEIGEALFSFDDHAPLGSAGDATARATMLVDSVAFYLFASTDDLGGRAVSGQAGWRSSEAAKVYVAEEWGGSSKANRKGGCDVGARVETAFDQATEATLMTRLPLGLPLGSAELYVYKCEFGLEGSLAYFGEFEAPPLSVEVASKIGDYALRDRRNDASMHLDENMVSWWAAFEYCNLTRSGASTTCAGMAASVKMASVELPDILAGVNGVNASTLPVLQSQMCAVAGHFFQQVALESPWHEVYVAAWMTRKTHMSFVAGRLEDLGYAQWGGGYVTYALWQIPSVLNIQRKGSWKFYDGDYTQDFVEFQSQAMAIGYSSMNLTLGEAKLLLRVLAARGSVATKFRGNIARVATSYRCDAADCGADGACDIAFSQKKRAGADLRPSQIGTCEAFGEICDCRAGGSYYVSQNAFANFTESVPWNDFPADNLARRTAERADSRLTRNDFADAAALLDRVFYSSAADCDVIQGYFRQCAFLSNEPGFRDWLQSCDEWETLVTDPTFGIYCDAGTILKIDTAYAHDYQSATKHPYPRKRGNVVAFWLQEWTVSKVMIQDRVVCDDPADCDYAAGGLFTTHSARRLLFEGYVDRVGMMLLNAELGEANLTAKCVDDRPVAVTESCSDVVNTECSDGGFSVEHSTGRHSTGPAAIFQRNGSRRAEWFFAELFLNLSDLSKPVAISRRNDSGVLVVRNPVFAIYAGKAWDPTAAEIDDVQVRDDVVQFHKELDCENRVLGGPSGLWRTCETTLNTGLLDLNDVFRVVRWHGNSSLHAGSPDGIRCDWGGLAQQTRPFGWEGWKGFNLSYDLRDSGLQYKGNSTMSVLDGQNVLLWQLDRAAQGDLDIGMADGSTEYYIEWPARRLFDARNYSREVWARVNRYEAGKRTFLDARRRALNSLADQHGEPYTVPIGFSSLQFLTGTPAFVSLPHFYGNEEWGGTEARQVYLDTPYDRRRHSYYVDVEPITGRALREARRLQYSFRVERNMLFPEIVSSQERCFVPTASFNDNGYGCFAFVPVWWISEERHIDAKHALRFKVQILDIPLRLFFVAVSGTAIGLALIVLGLVPWRRTHNKEVVFRKRVYVD